ncbi:MAG: sugar transferase [Lachnospiraceae bacterium]|nr:sugar transferase [Lachnospiraceae bacterium]
MYRKRKQLMEIAVCVVDAAAVLFSLLVAGMIRYQNMNALRSAEDIKGMCSIMILLHVTAFYFLKVYDGFFKRGRYRELLLSVKHNLILVAGGTLLGFSLKNDIFTSRLVMGYFFVINTTMIWLMHLFIRNRDRVLRFSQRKETSLLVVTTTNHLPEIVDRFHRSKETVWKIAGVVLLDGQPLPKGLKGLVELIPEDEEAYLEYATQHVVDEVFIQVDEIQKRERLLKNMILEFEKMGIVVNLNLDLFDLGLEGERRVYNLEQYQVLAFSSRLFDYRMVQIKRLIDILGALVGMVITVIVGVVLAPFLLLESPGPLIFCQKRVGVNGRVFHFYKFRSMYVDAEERKKELMAQNEVNGLMFKMENDPRVTKVGNFIRKTSIDELPQFWNVLKGDMSLVGTRPPTLDEYQQYSYYQKRRISFRPGITGLWQISGRSDIKDFDEVVKLDLKYIDNWSLVLDFKIIFKTILVVLRGIGAK